VNYDRSNIPNAEDLLGRTQVMGISVWMPEEKLAKIKQGIEKAAKSL
jgi:8-amino-3,8-dideoxy-alpha-D-manno-octulosonate transaminase